jgi:hypothetical protein
MGFEVPVSESASKNKDRVKFASLWGLVSGEPLLRFLSDI